MTLSKGGERKMYKSIDLFAGIGRIRLGFDYAFTDSIKTVFVSELDEYAKKHIKLIFMMILQYQEILSRFL